MSAPVRKRFGQHFLRDPRIVRELVERIAPQPHDRLVEIGPGQGALTFCLTQWLSTFDVIEIDRDLAAGLASDSRAAGLRIHARDALRVDFAALAGAGAPLRIVGNLPYNISTPFLFHLREHRQVIADMHFMLQKEVVDRIVASPGSKDYGRLTVMLATCMRAEHLFDVPRTAFAPQPRVDSAVLRLAPRPTALSASETRALEHIVRAAFSHRRKTLRNALRGVLDAEQIESSGIDPGVRPETLSPAQFEDLARKSAAARDAMPSQSAAAREF